MALPVEAATVPGNLLYEGRILDSSRNPITSAIVLRFSFWKSADWVSGDASGGSINTSATNYGGWYETQTITPSSNGIIQAQLGSGTTLPIIDFERHKYLQVEVKAVGQSDTSYVLLDPTGDNGADTVDRKVLASIAYAKNTESVGNRTVGTGSGNVLILGPDGRVRQAQMGSGTTAQNFMINASNAAGDTTLTFGNSLAPATLKYSASASRFEFSASVKIQGSLTVSGLQNCDTIDTNGSGTLVCGTDNATGTGLSQESGDARYVKRQGGTMTGNLTISNGAGLTASGSIATEGGVTINKDNAAQDAVLTFGNALGTKMLQYSNTNRRFEFNDSVSVTGNLTVSGRINGAEFSSIMPLRVASGAGLSISVASGSYRLGSILTNYPGSSSVSVTANTTSYVFIGSGGLTVRTAAFPTDESFIPLAVVTTGATGVTAVADRRTLQSDTREHDQTTILTPEFDKAAYQADASDNVGQLTMTQDNITQRNYYLWTSSRPTLQDYDIFVRFTLPQDFVRWKSDGSTNPLQLSYRTTSANATDNKLDLSIYDTAGSPVTLSGSTTNLASTSWATTQIELLGTPIWTAGQEFLMKFHLSAKDSYQIHIGSLELRYTLLTGQ